MKRIATAVFLAAILSAAPTGMSRLHAAEAQASKSSMVLEGLVSAVKNKSGDIGMIVFKTATGNLLVPAKSFASFAPFDGKKVKACCIAKGNSILPVYVLGPVQARNIPKGAVR